MSRLITVPANKDLVKLFEDGTFGEYTLQCSINQLDSDYWLTEDKIGCRVLNTEDIYDASTPPELIYPKGWYEVKEIIPATDPRTFAWFRINEGGGSVEVDDVTIETNADGKIAVKPLGVDTDQISDESITAAKLNDMGATNGQVLKYVNKTEAGVTTKGWFPSDPTDTLLDNKSLKINSTTEELYVNAGEGLEVGTTALNVLYDDDLKLESNKLTHANEVDELTTEKLVQVAYDENGHITSSTEITFDDDLNIDSTHVLKHTNELDDEQTDMKPVNISIDKFGHITEYEDTELEDLDNVDETVTANEGDVLTYTNVGTEASPDYKWAPKEVKPFEIVNGTITAGANSVEITDDKLKGTDLMLRFMFEPAAGSDFENIYLKRYTLDETAGKLNLYFYKAVSANTRIRVLVN